MITMTASYQGEKHVRISHGPSQSVIETDAPKDNNGRGESFSPTDLIGAGLASCAMTVMAIRAEKLGLAIEEMTSVVTKEMAENPRRIVRLHLRMSISKTDGKSARPFSSDQKRMLEEAAHGCPVRKSVSSEMDVPIEIEWV